MLLRLSGEAKPELPNYKDREIAPDIVNHKTVAEHRRHHLMQMRQEAHKLKESHQIIVIGATMAREHLGNIEAIYINPSGKHTDNLANEQGAINIDLESWL